MSISNAEKRLAIALENIVKNAVRDDHDAALCVVHAKLINQASYLLQSLYPTDTRSDEEKELGLLPKLVLTRSGDGWSLHPPGTTDEQIANGEVEPLATGPNWRSALAGKKWSRPNDQDYTNAYRRLLNVEISRISAFSSFINDA